MTRQKKATDGPQKVTKKLGANYNIKLGTKVNIRYKGNLMQ